MSDSQIGLDFLNKNLEEYFKKKEYSIIGTAAGVDAVGIEYTSYALETFDIPSLDQKQGFSGLLSFLNQAKNDVDGLILGLMQAKSAEKPEGAAIAKRDVEVHWRRFPEISINDGNFDVSPRMSIYFRISIHHKH